MAEATWLSFGSALSPGDGDSAAVSQEASSSSVNTHWTRLSASWLYLATAAWAPAITTRTASSPPIDTTWSGAMLRDFLSVRPAAAAMRAWSASLRKRATFHASTAAMIR